MNRRIVPIVLVAIPAVALTFGIPVANRFDPELGGAPFLLAWIVGWLLLMPLCVYTAYRIQRQP